MMKKATMKIDGELMQDIKDGINNAIDGGRNCGGLRKSDSHERRVRYLFEVWKWYINGGMEREFVGKELLKQQVLEEAKKELAKELREKADAIDPREGVK